ncbi:hypothetical protein [Phycicoccus avicenniae]|uniref:hypothetical protein n=1 Tax=Phycicoccus avicenniae TaxID=2828860 RepID=UPI003D27E92B
MTSPRHAEATALGRYYTHPITAESLISVTNVLSVGCAKPALVPWAAKIVAEHSWDLLPRMAGALRAKDCGAGPKRDQACGRCRDCLTRELKGEVTVARDKASDLGTRVHHLAEQHVLGVEVAEQEGDDVARQYLAQYLAFLEGWGVDLEHDVEAVEVTVANPRLGYAGTLDLIIRLPLDGFVAGQKVQPLPDGKKSLWLVDLKTSETRAATSVYGEYALQLAALRFASEVWLPDDTTAPMVKGITGAAVLNLRRRTFELVPLPTGKAEFDAFQGSLALSKWMHSTGHDINGGTYRPITRTGAVKPKRGATTRKAA